MNGSSDMSVTESLTTPYLDFSIQQSNEIAREINNPMEFNKLKC